MKRPAPHQTKEILIILFSFALSGCATDRLNAELPLLQGKPVSEAVHYLGNPTEKNNAPDKTVYSWINDESENFPAPDSAMYPSVVQANGHPIVVFHEPTTPPPGHDDWSCRLDIVANRGIILHTEYSGTGGACRVFSDKLRPLVEESAQEQNKKSAE